MKERITEILLFATGIIAWVAIVVELNRIFRVE